MHFVVVLPAGARRNERARGAHLQKHKRSHHTQQGGLGSGVFFAVVMRYLTEIWFSFLKYCIYDIFVRPPHPHGAEIRFPDVAIVFFFAAGCGGHRGGGAGRFLG